MKSILFVTATSLATNPRLVKELRTSVSLGYNVTVVSFEFQNWSKPLNDRLITEFEQKVQFVTLPGDRTNKREWIKASFVHLLARFFIRLKPNNIYFTAIAFSKQSWLLLLALRRLHIACDLVIAHNPGAFLPAFFYAEKVKGKLGFDLEDYHPGEHNDPVVVKRLTSLMRKLFTRANVITASSPLILSQSESLIMNSKIKRTVIQNVFSVKLQPAFKQEVQGPLKLIWFSQTIGLNRGLQDAVQAMGCIDNFTIHLTIIGNCKKDSEKFLLGLLPTKKHAITFLPPMPEELLVGECNHHHIGLALEPGFSLNNSMALSNKLFTYLLAGNAIVASETPAQKKFLEENPSVGETYSRGDYRQLATLLRNYYYQPEKLNEARMAAYELAKNEMNWEKESKKFVAIYGLN